MPTTPPPSLLTALPAADRDVLDVIVIGAGQAGLALGYHLTHSGKDFVILDAGPEVGHAWRTRWDSLRLFSPAEYDALPGMPFPAPAGTHPSKDDVADYLRDYAQHFRLPVRVHSAVTRLHRDEGCFAVSTATGTVRARQVVVATGPFQRPHIPAIASQLPSDVVQLHSAEYRNPTQLPGPGRVLVVGAANSGLQIAAELAATQPVTVAVGSRPMELPQRVLGRDLFFWLTKSGFFSVPSGSRIARRLRARGDLVIGTRTRALRRLGIDFRPRLTGVTGRTARFADGTNLEFDSVVWATGFRPDYRWLHIPGVVVDGEVRHDAGVTGVTGLYFLGLPWQTCRGSALLGFVGADAATLSLQMAADERRSHRPTGEPDTAGVRPQPVETAR
jgi:putative flavoprotein involved in K+ transport